jgi:hypothetical protein
MQFNNIIGKFCIAIIALQVLNMSVYTNEFKPLQNNSNFGDFNYLNSFTEFIVEIVLKKTDAFPEFLKHNSSQSQNVKHIDIKLFQPNEIYSLNIHYKVILCINKHLDDTYSSQFYQEINPPPPKV